MQLELDHIGNSAYASFSDRPSVKTRELDSQRLVDYDADREIVGIEFLNISEGVDLRDLPRADQLARLFDDRQIRQLV